jgi:hypothetical protein
MSRMKTILFAAIIVLMLIQADTPRCALFAQDSAPFPSDCWGVYSWCSWNPRTVTRETCPLIRGAPIVLHWNSLEPNEGEHAFERLLDERLQAAVDNDFYTFLMIWVGPSSPDWLYEIGVPLVRCEPTVSPKREVRHFESPYYFDPTYTDAYYRLIRAFGEYVRSLPDEKRRRILFVQCCEGSTGDGFCYKGDPLDPQYAISRAEWGEYRIRAWDVFREAFIEGERPPVPLLVNDDANAGPEHDWLLENLDVIGCKQGMFSHGYHISDAARRVENWQVFSSEAAELGKTVFTRGEQDAEWQVCGWSRQNPQQALYWSAIYATHCGLDIWNLPAEACQGETYGDAIRFFTKYAGQHDPATAPSVFCALRRGLDASDAETFPESDYGRAVRSNVDRYVAITDSLREYGAMQGDPGKATRGGMINRQRDDYNDVGWRILPGNYCRFLEQIDADETSDGYWHVGPKDSIYGRFARGFALERGQNVMSFRLDERSFAEPNAPNRLTVSVIYLDQGKGRWTLSYFDAASRAVVNAAPIICEDSDKWRRAEFSIEAARLDGSLPKDADLQLRHLGGENVLFHLIEAGRFE